MTTSKLELREKIDSIVWGGMNRERQVNALEALITQTVNEVLGRIEAESVQEFPMSSGENIAFVPLSVIQAARKEYEG